MNRLRLRTPRALRRPSQGWSSLLLLLTMLVVVAISVADRRPLMVEGPTAGSATDRIGALMIVMLAAGLIGYLLARSRIGVVRAHTLGAAAGAFVLLMIAGAAVDGSTTVVPQSWDELTARIVALRGRLELDVLANRDDVRQIPTAVTLLILGAIGWTTAQFCAFGVYRHGRGGPAVVATGALLLFVRVGFDALEPKTSAMAELAVPMVYAVLAMLLLIRLQLTELGVQWLRKHIADAGEVSRLFLRTGTVFVAVSIVGATSLTAVAQIPVGAPDLRGLDDRFDDLGGRLSHWLSFLGVPFDPYEPQSLGDRVVVPEVWEPGEGTAFTATLDGSLRGNYWWQSAFHDFDGRSWSRDTADTGQTLDADQALEIADEASGRGPNGMTVTIEVGDNAPSRTTVVAPAEPVQVAVPVLLRAVGEDEGLAELAFPRSLDAGRSYVVESLAHDYSQQGSSLDANLLRASPREYPAWVAERYLGVRPPAIGPLTEAEAAAIQAVVEGTAQDNPYDIALIIQDRLRGMEYSDRIDCPSEPFTECLLGGGEGFCSQFASTMIMLLRMLDVPARYVYGYLPGSENDGVWTVPQQAYHNWVEVYFTDYGWVRFDPTPGDRLSRFGQERTDLPASARPEPPAASQSPSPQPEPEDSSKPEATVEPLSDASDFGGPTSGNGDVLAALVLSGGIASLILLVAGSLFFVRLRRLPDGGGGLAYRGIVSLATHLGLGPHPSHTEYEYAANLSKTLPDVHDDLFLVAETRVASAYGRRSLTAGRRKALRRAYARVRTALVRYVSRRRR